MNPEVQQLFAEYRKLIDDDDRTAALLTLADVLSRKPVEHIFVEPDGCHSYSVKETAVRLGIESQDVYHLILAGKLHCFWSGSIVRIPLSEIERYEANVQPSTVTSLCLRENQ